MPPVVYLDQRDWVYLARAKNGDAPSHLPDIGTVLDFVLTTAANGDVVYPIDLTRIRETAKHTRHEHRDAFFDFLFDVSRGYTIAPYGIVSQEEAVWRVDRLKGNPGYMTGRVVSRGAPHLFGGANYRVSTTDPKTDITDVVSKEELQEMHELIESRAVFEFLRDLDHDMLEMLADHNDWGGMADHLNRTRHAHDEKYNDTENRRRREKIRSFMTQTIPDYFAYGLQEGLSVEELSADLGDYWSGAPGVEAAEAFLQSFPSEYCFTELSHQRDIQGSNWESNDIADIQSLAVAIPYCDVVTADKQFADLASRSDLGKTYHAEIIKDLSALPSAVQQRMD